MSFLTRIGPVATVAMVTLLAALPWGLPAPARFFLPLLPFVVIHYWALRHPARMPEWAVFLAGLAFDVLSNGPLGFWALIYLVGYVFAILSAPFAEEGVLGRWLLFLAALLLASASAWLLSSIYYFEFADPWPFAVAAAALGALYPVLAAFLRGLDPEHRRPRNVTFERGK